MKCEICNKELDKTKFFTNKFNEPFGGKCKECIYKQIQNDIIKAIPYLDTFDLPYIPNAWGHYLKTHSNVFGVYLNFCKLKTMKNHHFTDIVYFGNDKKIYKKQCRNFKKELIKYIKEK